MEQFSQALHLRDTLHQAIRSFFHGNDYLEVYTPLRVYTPAMESHIDALTADDMYLRTSPEAHMKRLLCTGYQRQFQLGPCFRKDEQGHMHHPEFTLLEWYQSPANYLDLIEETHNLLTHCHQQLTLSSSKLPPLIALPQAPWKHLSVKALFLKHSDWNPLENFDADRFNIDWVERIEPALDPTTPTIVKDFPIQLAAMAQPHPKNPKIAERWELYWQGLELANAYGELLDSEAMRNRFKTWGQERAERDQPVYATDEAFLKALEKPTPPAAGIALGVERLMMALTGIKTLNELLPFRDG